MTSLQNSVPVTSPPTPPTTPISTSSVFADEPILALLDIPLSEMSADQLREFTTRMRSLRVSPQALSSALTADLGKLAAKTKASKANALVDDLMSDL